MRVTLLACTPNALEVMFKAARTCYSEASPVSVVSDYDKMLKLVTTVLKSGHESIAEHINFTFVIDGISRAASHQLVRHRHASYSQQSQRYVTYGHTDVYEPETILKNREADAIFNAFIDQAEEAYKTLLALDIPAEDARYVLPNAMTSNITVTLNLRELMHICGLRLCSRAQKEIRDIIKAMAVEVVKQYDFLKPLLVAKCERLGFCTEDKCCGRKKKLDELSQHN